MTLSADAGDVALPPETFKRFGSLSYVAEIPPAAFQKGRVLPVIFTFDKALTPAETDGRELSVVVTEVSLEARLRSTQSRFAELRASV